MSFLPHPWQQESIDTLAPILKTTGSTLDASDCGAGKTYVAAGLCQRLGLSAYVVAPKATLPAWREVLTSAGVQIDAIESWEKARRTKKIEHQPGRLFLFDEVHKAKNRQTANAKFLLKAAAKGRIHMMSATAVMDPLDMGAIGPVLGMFQPREYWNWCLSHGCTKGIWGGLDFSGEEKILNDIHKSIFPAKGVRLRKDSIPGFPDCSVEVMELDLGAAVAKAYRSMAKQAGVKVDELYDAAGEADNPLTRNLHLRQAVELAKAPALVELVQSFLDEGTAPVLFLNFRETVELVEKHFPTAAVIMGGRDNQEAMNRFQDGRAGVSIVSIGCGGSGIGLHDINGICPRVGLLCPTDDPRAAEQAEGRINRDGSKSKSALYKIFAAGTVEAVMAVREKRKRKQIKTVNDGIETPPNAVVPATASKPKRKRSEFPPSALENFEASPCFEISRFTSTPFTEAGQRVHKSAETGDLSHCQDDEEKLAAEKCLAYAKRFTGSVEKELRVTIRPGTYGLADHVVINGSHCDLIDWKAGKHKQAAADVNFQQQAYTIALFDLHPELLTLTVHLVYPRLDAVSQHTYHRSGLPVLKSRLEDTVAAVKAARVSGEYTVSAACRNCKKQGGCPAMAEKAAAVVRSYSKELVVPDFAAHASQVKDPQMMGHLMKVAKTMKEWCASVEHHAKQLVLEDNICPEGYELAHKAGRREIKDATAAYGAVMDVLTPDEFLNACTVSASKLEIEYAKKAKRGFKKVSKMRLAERLADTGILNTGGDSPYLKKISG